MQEMKYYYSLRIDCKESDILAVNDILQVECNYPEVGWGYELIQKEEDEYIDFIDEFLDILDAKYSALQEIGIGKNQISVWLIYEYKDQCNLEFAPENLKRLGDNGITLCISCYEAGE
jgi:hypothetical protein